MTWRSRLGDNLASRWSGRGSTYGRGNFIYLSWPFWFCLFVCLFPSPIGWFQFIHIAVVFTFQMKMPKKNRKGSEIYQVDQWRSLKTEKSLGTTLQSCFLPGIFQESFFRQCLIYEHSVGIGRRTTYKQPCWENYNSWHTYCGLRWIQKLFIYLFKSFFHKMIFWLLFDVVVIER